MSVVALVGAQYGSEGKGAIAKVVAKDFDVHIRTGGPNAGHTIYEDGVKYVMRSVPCGFINPNAHLVIGPGALVDIELLIEEVKELDEHGWDVASRLRVDKRAMVIDPVRHRDFEGGTHGRAHQLIGSTGEGVGPARMARLARGTFSGKGISAAWARIDSVASYEEDLDGHGIKCFDSLRPLNAWIELGADVLLEGTQGSGLSLIHGHWPKVTSHDTNAGQLLVDAGISPGLLDYTILVARTFPIRVAGDSGPLHKEETWEQLGLEPEYTTVTKKMRRVGWWDDDLLAKALILNRPARLALTFADYWWPQLAGVTSPDFAQNGKKIGNDTRKEIRERIHKIERRHDVYIKYIGTGPDSVIVR